MAPTDLKPPPRIARNRFGFWAVAFAFVIAMAFTTVPTPLWSLYARSDHFSSLTVTIVFAAYALAVALSLFLAGHLSDSYGRRRVLMPALALEILAGVVFVVWPSLPGLLLARVVSGVGIGAVTATATAWLPELGGNENQHPQVVAASANLGGLGLGGLISGMLAQWAGTRCACRSWCSSRRFWWRGWRSAPRLRRTSGHLRDRPIAPSGCRCRRAHAVVSSPPHSAPRLRSRSSVS